MWGRCQLVSANTKYGMVVLLLLLWGASGLDDDDSDLQNCINVRPSTSATAFDHFLNEDPQPLRIHKSWSSNKPRIVNLTIATSLTFSRLANLAAQCKSWQGPLSAVLYTDISAPGRRSMLSEDRNSTLQLLVESLDVFHQRMERTETACELDLLLVYEAIADPIMHLLVPINSMRNHALLNVKTALVAMVDVDLIISKSLYADLTSPGRMEALIEECRQDTVYVLPAFDLDPSLPAEKAFKVVDRAVTLDKADLWPIFKRGTVAQFAGKRFAAGHQATNYKKWFRTREAYDIEDVHTYEPWFIIDRFRNPFYDARFRGYGFNKISHVDTLRSMNFQFKAHPAGFIVHRPHEKTHSEIIFRKRSFKNSKLRVIKKVTRDLHRAISRSITLGQYDVVVDTNVNWCLALLHWWKNNTVNSYLYL